jgi:hypothetical protein
VSAVSSVSLIGGAASAIGATGTSAGGDAGAAAGAADGGETSLGKLAGSSADGGAISARDGCSSGACCADAVQVNASQAASTHAGENARAASRRCPIIGHDPIGRRSKRLGNVRTSSR